MFSKLYPISYKYLIVVDYLVVSACCLHNFLRNRYFKNTDNVYHNFDTNKPPPSEIMTPLTRIGGNANFGRFVVQDKLQTFFNSPGCLDAVEWQNQQALQTDSQ